jgi:monoamine oxidase
MDRVQSDVCIVGAGFAGLAAAYKLHKAGRSVVVVEARDRVGGKVNTQLLPDGTAINMGGTWIGDGHTRLRALAQEMGLETYPQYTQGDNIIAVDGKVRRYAGTIPKVNPFALADVGLAVMRLDSMASSIPLEAPWTAEQAREWDSTTIGAWLDSRLHVTTDTAREMLRAVFSELHFSDPSEVSLLHALYQVHSCRSLEWLGSTTGGAQQDLVQGGMHGVARQIAARLGERVRLRSPVRAIAQRADGIEVRADTLTASARHVIVALPMTLAGRLDYDPPLPPDRACLMDRSPQGQGYKWHAVYPDAFWRSDGLSGLGLNLNGLPGGFLDCSPRDGKPGVLACFGFGPHARPLAKLSPAERQRRCVDGLVQLFGPKAANPVHFIEMDWAAEPFTRGDMFAHWAPGVLTSFGPALRAPCGRIHWAGTESAIRWQGSIEGAIESGERAADEVLGNA